MIQGDICGKVRLEPHMIVDNTGISVNFKLGADRLYVLKDVFGFVRAVENHENISYGKNLQFVHALDAFEESSRPLVSFLIRWAEKMNIAMAGITRIMHPMEMQEKKYRSVGDGSRRFSGTYKRKGDFGIGILYG